jgi:hypothetical protein
MPIGYHDTPVNEHAGATEFGEESR